jgi:hypothetical protein
MACGYDGGDSCQMLQASLSHSKWLPDYAASLQHARDYPLNAWSLSCSWAKSKSSSVPGISNNESNESDIGARQPLWHMVGGRVDTDRDQRYHEAYDPVTKKWSQLSSCINPRSNGAMIATLDGLQLIVTGKLPCNALIFAPTHVACVCMCIGGTRDHKSLKACERYSLASDRWLPIGSMESNRSHHGIVITSTHVYVLGGHDGDSPLDTIERLELNTHWPLDQHLHMTMEDSKEKEKLNLAGSSSGDCKSNGEIGLDHNGLKGWETLSCPIPFSGWCRAIVIHDQLIVSSGGSNWMTPLQTLQQIRPLSSPSMGLDYQTTKWQPLPFSRFAVSATNNTLLILPP